MKPLDMLSQCDRMATSSAISALGTARQVSTLDCREDAKAARSKVTSGTVLGATQLTSYTVQGNMRHRFIASSLFNLASLFR